MAIKDVGKTLSIVDSVRWLIRDIQIQASYADFSERINTDYIPNEVNWIKALTIANVLSLSDDIDCKEKALRIAHHCLSSTITTEQEKELATVVLRNLSNLISIFLAKQKGLISRLESRLPAPLLIDKTKRQLSTRIILSNGEYLDSNEFQSGLWDAISYNNYVTISAPTSVGKSFIVEKWIEEFLSTKCDTKVVYLVPTRALVQQVENDFRKVVQDKHLDNIEITSIPLEVEFKQGKNYLFIFTQERLQILLSSMPEPPGIDIIIVDEAHKIADSQRGVLLQHVLEDVFEHNQNSKVIFISPQISDPKVVVPSCILNTDKVKVVVNECPMVNQNLFWVSQLPTNSKNWGISLCLKTEEIKIGNIHLVSTPSSPLKRLPFVAQAIAGEDTGNVIYVNGPADAEKTALLLSDLLLPLPPSDSVDRLVEMVKKTIHPEYLLAKVLVRGVAFHYGNMPLLIRTEIETLFSEGTLKYLVCTSTLIEGVNMACRNIFVRGPQRGRNKPMTEEDFWNLAGRAGRWGKEFQGNIFCVDANMSNLWQGGEPPRYRKSYTIEKPLETILVDPTALLAFIQSRTEKGELRKNRAIESVFSYLAIRHFRYGSLENIPWMTNVSKNSIKLLSETMAQALAGLKLPVKILEDNPGIDPLSMQDLLDYFAQRNKPSNEYLPVDPSSNTAVERFTSIFGCTYNHLGSSFGPASRTFYLSMLVVNWMRGYPLPRLISERYKREKSSNDKTNISSVIRNVMMEVETIARFEAPKYIRCYTDILKHYCALKGENNLTNDLPNYNLFLEFGVSIKTQISLIKLGLSRTSAILLSDITAHDSFSELECLEWLRSDTRWRTSDLPHLVVKEIEDLLVLQKEHLSK